MCTHSVFSVHPTPCSVLGPLPMAFHLKFVTTLKSEVYHPISQIRKLRHGGSLLSFDSYFSSIYYYALGTGDTTVSKTNKNVFMELAVQ